MTIRDKDGKISWVVTLTIFIITASATVAYSAGHFVTDTDFEIHKNQEIERIQELRIETEKKQADDRRDNKSDHEKIMQILSEIKDRLPRKK